MKKIITLLIIVIMASGMFSCIENNANDIETSSEAVDFSSVSAPSDGQFIKGKDGNVGTFSYYGYKKYQEKQREYQVASSKFKNTTEIETTTKEKAIELAKKEIVCEYNRIDVYYDSSESIWGVLFSFDYMFGQHIFIDNKGMTRLITYIFYPINDDVVPCSTDSYIENLELIGGNRRNPSEFKNITEFEIKTKDDVIRLAKNEVTRQYDRIFVNYDKSKSIWGVIFWVDEKPYGGSYVFIDNKGITQNIIDVQLLCNNYIEYMTYLENNGGIRRNQNEFKNVTEIEIDINTFREEAIELAKNELNVKYENDNIIVYYDYINGMFMISFYENETVHNSQHIFIDRNNGETKFIIDIK